MRLKYMRPNPLHLKWFASTYITIFNYCNFLKYLKNLI